MKKFVICFCVYLAALVIADLALKLTGPWLFSAGFIAHSIYAAASGDDNEQS